MVLVDLGGINPDDPPNPNVMYELGIRHAFGLPVVLLGWEGQRLPFDVNNQRAILSRRDFLDIEPTRNKLSKFIHAAGQGKYYNPMEAVGREAAIEKASQALGEESLLGALASEVRNLRAAVLGRLPTPARWQRQRTIKKALGTKKIRSELWSRARTVGYDVTSWSNFLSTALTQERFDEMAKWTPDEWFQYIKDSTGEFMSSERYSISEEILHAVSSELPAQPWPQGIHRVVAEKLGLSARDVSRAIQYLIESGVFSNQINGIVIARDEAD
jgi:hypothetical protein